MELVKMPPASPDRDRRPPLPKRPPRPLKRSPQLPEGAELLVLPNEVPPRRIDVTA